VPVHLEAAAFLAHCDSRQDFAILIGAMPERNGFDGYTCCCNSGRANLLYDKTGLTALAASRMDSAFDLVLARR
jgi:hypothetical protein